MAHLGHFINTCTLGGNIVQTPILTFVPQGSRVFFTLVVQDRFRPQVDVGGEPLFIDVNAKGPLAEYVQKYLPKGAAIIVDGYLRMRRWTGRDGKVRRTYYVLARNIHSLTYGSAKAAAKKRFRKPDGEDADIESEGGPPCP